MQDSVLDQLIVDELVHECDVVVHLAAAVGVKLIVERPLPSLTTNIRGSEIVMEAAHRHRRRILVTSTSEIYGKNTSVLSETSDRILVSPSVARWAYSRAKAVDEILAYAYHKERGLATIVVRLFNTVGPRQSPAYGMVIPRLVRQAVGGRPPSTADGNQTRCFCHVTDVVDALLLLLDNPAAIGQGFNVGSREEISIIALARLIADLTGSRSTVELIPYDKAYESGFEDMLRRVPDTTKISDLTGWKVTHRLDEILRQCIREAELEFERQQAQHVLERA